MENTTAYVLISRDSYLLRWCILNARLRAGIDHDWLVVLWINPDEPEAPRAEIRAFCKAEGIRIAEFVATREREHDSRTAWFLHSLYRAWNLGMEASETKWVARMGSDQFFSKGWLKNLHLAAEKHGERATYHCWTVESTAAKHSRHDVQDWGTTWQTFDHPRFEQYASDLIYRYQHQVTIPGDECDLMFRHPARGLQHRADGATWLMTKVLWEEFGPMRDTINEEGVTGDVDFLDRMGDAGVPAYLVPISATFHLVAGESRDIQQR